MGRYDGAIAGTMSAIQSKGGPVKITIVTRGTVNVVEDTEAGVTVTVFTPRALILPAKVPFGTSYEEGTLIRQTQRKLLVAGASLPGVTEVPPGTVCEFAGEAWTVQPGSTALDPDGSGTPILHTLQVKR